jgi:hypothetical protein
MLVYCIIAIRKRRIVNTMCDICKLRENLYIFRYRLRTPQIKFEGMVKIQNIETIRSEVITRLA